MERNGITESTGVTRMDQTRRCGRRRWMVPLADTDNTGLQRMAFRCAVRSASLRLKLQGVVSGWLTACGLLHGV